MLPRESTIQWSIMSVSLQQLNKCDYRILDANENILKQC